MNIGNILTELRSGRDRISQAIAAIELLDSTGRRKARLAGVTSPPNRRRRRLSDAARRKLSRLLKQRWAAGKMSRSSKAEPVQASRRMSAAGRKRISQATKRRWAEWRKKQVAKAA